MATATAPPVDDHLATALSEDEHLATGSSEDDRLTTAPSEDEHLTAASSEGEHLTAASSEGEHLTAASSEGEHLATALSVDERLTAALRARGQRVTPQRLVIARAIGESNRHVTADAIFEEVSERLPGLSLPTVYATLDLLEELGTIRRVATESGTVVYDSRPEAHDHLVCRRCGKIADVDAELDRERMLQLAANTDGFTPDEAQVIVRGLCGDCLAGDDAQG